MQTGFSLENVCSIHFNFMLFIKNAYINYNNENKSNYFPNLDFKYGSLPFDQFNEAFVIVWNESLSILETRRKELENTNKWDFIFFASGNNYVELFTKDEKGLYLLNLLKKLFNSWWVGDLGGHNILDEKSSNYIVPIYEKLNKNKEVLLPSIRFSIIVTINSSFPSECKIVTPYCYIVSVQNITKIDVIVSTIIEKLKEK